MSPKSAFIFHLEKHFPLGLLLFSKGVWVAVNDSCATAFLGYFPAFTLISHTMGCF